MKFRTEIEVGKSASPITHDDSIVLLGSCFSDNMGSRLQRDGFNVTFNPMGPLYNPISIARVVTGLLDGRTYRADDFSVDAEGVSHCLDFASRYQNSDPHVLANTLNDDMAALRAAFNAAGIITLTFGSSVIYTLSGDVGSTVGNCHKFPATHFKRMAVSVDDIVEVWRPLARRIISCGKRILLTVSPIRHLADGLHGNELSKARLLLAADALGDLVEYFPAYEIMMDDLRDYRFYDRDLKHPSDVACDYIYEKFGERYFSRETAGMAIAHREAARKAAHRQII